MIYHITPSKIHPYFLDFRLTFTTSEDNQRLQLPLWRPGRYQVQTFAKNIRYIKAIHSKGTLKVQTVGRNTWTILNSKKGEKIELHYEYYARHQDAGGTWVSETFWLINFIGTGILPRGLSEEEIKVDVSFPSTFDVATSAKKQKGIYSYQNFDELVDTPFMAGKYMHHKTFEMAETTFHVWLHGQINPDWEKIITDFRLFTAPQLSIFGGFPHKEFHYLCLIPHFKHYHGVEHQKSTVITLGPDTEFSSVTFYENLLGISSHELFHVWNIKKIRPVELLPYNLFEEVYFDTGFVAEGVTTYYGDALLYRSGAYSKTQYKKELNQLLTRHFENQGRFNLSVADSSLELWTDGYEKGIPARKTSIYVKGAVGALILDAKIQKQTKGHKSLDDVMRLMWERFGSQDIGYTAKDYQNIAEEVIGCSLNKYFDEVIFGEVALEEEVKEALIYLGWNIEITSPKDVFAANYGVKIDASAKVIDTSFKLDKQGLVEGDQIIAINGVKTDAQHLQKFVTSKENLTVTFIRDSTLHQIELFKKNILHYLKINVT
ncbi:M61 family metallopeptidase [Flammeovirga kamogawensis]|uniref:M61 family peptidase n=1 Tax=Flammeovirga kamogawensis TaxID=373891 RepID=A0ABX8GYJ7_9BACT|nr:M61 family metallopeptidase [Flammeovirga kamogawensis]MBB6458915.1 putative metalloprotease with PDZ domain [Flammeovirga kamogawensis]QWG08494.1 M61 family peptidase [Flammeovirga kamogawensis]TRX66789.1 M61 family metallopeptidase [Flammeovirga kamogawensis]